MRDLLARHQIIVAVVLFAGVMISLKLWVLPQLFASFGYGGLVLVIVGAFVWAFWLERRQPTDSGS
jgi:hypothetical protein